MWSSPARRWRFLLRRAVPPSAAASAPPQPGFREGDTFVPERILALDEPLAVLHATSQALACCALAPTPCGSARRRHGAGAVGSPDGWR